LYKHTHSLHYPRAVFYVTNITRKIKLEACLRKSNFITNGFYLSKVIELHVEKACEEQSKRIKNPYWRKMDDVKRKKDAR